MVQFIINPFTSKLDAIGNGGGGTPIETIDGDSGSATGSTITITGGSTGLTFAGSGSTLTQGGTLGVANGGTGVDSQAAYSLVCGGTSSTGPFQAVADVATGSVLVSGGTSALPAFSATPSVTSITLGGGSALGKYTSTTSWSPTLVGGTLPGTTTYITQAGYYLQIGNLVYVFGHIDISAATGTGNATISVPVASGGQIPQGSISINASASWPWPTGGTSATLALNGTTTAVVEISGSAKGLQYLQMANAAFECFFSILYSI